MFSTEERRLYHGLVDKFSNPNGLVVDLFSGAVVTAKVCRELPRHHHLVGRDVATECFAASTEAPAGAYTRQVLNEMSEISSTNKVVKACKIMVPALN